MRKKPAKPYSSFDGYVTRLRQSRNRLQRRSACLGQILGASGSDNSEPPTDAASDSIGPSGGAPVIVLDLKGDTALFNTVRIDTRRAGRRFTKSPPLLPS